MFITPELFDKPIIGYETRFRLDVSRGTAQLIFSLFVQENIVLIEHALYSHIQYDVFFHHQSLKY